MSELCLKCNMPVTSRQQALQCDGCDGWQHRKCGTSITQQQYREAVRSGSIEWKYYFAGIDIVTLANNHIDDYGTRSVNYTIDLLSQIGIQPFGYTYGRTEEDKPQTPLLVEVNGIRIGFLAYCAAFRAFGTPEGKTYFYCIQRRGDLTAGAAIYSDKAATRDVNNLKSKVDVIVVFMHWGVAYVTHPKDRQKREARHLQSLGVQIIIGAHPHVLEGYATSGRDLIAYSLGNFLFVPKKWSRTFNCNRQPPEKTVEAFEKYMTSPACLADPTAHSRILRVQIDKKGLVAASYLPLRITFDPISKCLQPTPTGAKWITVCSPDDKACLN